MRRRQAERQRFRKGRLQDRLLAPKTVKCYRLAFSLFLEFCLGEAGRLPGTAEAADLALCRFIEHLWQDGAPRGWASNAKSAVAHYVPVLGRRMYGAQRLLLALDKDELPARAPPLTLQFARALAGAAAAKIGLHMCLVLLLGFFGLLRPGELMQVRAAHFVFTAGSRIAVLTLPFTKSGQRLQSVAESVILEDPTTVACARAVVGQLKAEDLIFPGGDKMFRDQFRSTCKFAGLPAVGWLPYSLRRGGATTHFLLEGSLDKTVVRGRWKSVRTARIYIDQSLAALAQLSATGKQLQCISEWENFLARPVCSAMRQSTK